VLSLAHPAWLAGLLLLPAVRWLHRGGAPLQRWPVAHLLLWQAPASAQAETAGSRDLDPAWRRRCALLTLLLLALAAPQWQASPRPQVTVWLADSASMALLEPGGVRGEQAVALARQQLAAERPGADLQWRRMSRPWVEGLTAPQSAASQPPPVELLDAGREHWWLGDGSDARLAQWARPASRVLRVGSAQARNAGWRQALARRAPDGRLLLQAELANGGAAVEARSLSLWVDGQALGAPQAHTLAVDAARWLSWTLPAASRRIELRLEPADDLPGDDRLGLELTPLQRLVMDLDPACPAALRRAAITHPGLRLATPGEAAALALRCSSGATVATVATVAAGAAGATGTTGATPRMQLLWHAGPARQRAQTVLGPRSLTQFVPARLGANRALRPAPRDELLLSAAAQPLALRRVDGTIEVAIDPLSLPELPLALEALLKSRTGVGLLDPLVQSEPRSVEVRPGAPPAALEQRAEARGASGAPRSLVLPCVMLAAALLGWELWQLGRRLRRVGR